MSQVKLKSAHLTKDEISTTAITTVDSKFLKTVKKSINKRMKEFEIALKGNDIQKAQEISVFVLNACRANGRYKIKVPGSILRFRLKHGLSNT